MAYLGLEGRDPLERLYMGSLDPDDLIDLTDFGDLTRAEEIVRDASHRWSFIHYSSALKDISRRLELFTIGQDLERAVREGIRPEGLAFDITSPVALSFLSKTADFMLETAEGEDAILKLSSILKTALTDPEQYWGYTIKVQEIFEEAKYSARVFHEYAVSWDNC